MAVDIRRTSAKPTKAKSSAVAPVDGNGVPCATIRLSLIDLTVLRDALDDFVSADDLTSQVADSLFERVTDQADWLEGRIDTGNYVSHVRNGHSGVA